MRANVAGPVLCALVALLFPSVVEAQEQQRSSLHNTLHITNTLLDGLKVGVNTELRLRKEFQQLLASYKTPEQYDACQAEVGMSEEGQKIMSQMTTLKDPVKPEDLQRVIEKMDVEMKALLKNKCGDDIRFVWPEGKQSEKLAEIEVKAAEAVDPSAEPPGPDLDGSSVGAGEPFAAGIDIWSYRVLKERIPPFCIAYEKGAIKLDGNPVSIPGHGTRVFWVYSAQEAAFLAPRCKEFMALLEQLL
jgi:hypothetical protein